MAREPAATTTTYAVLGMLTFGAMSGYDLRKFVEGSIAAFFSPAKSHVYAELRRLVGLGWATERRVAQSDRPDKRVYRITAAGRAALRRWLEIPADEPELIRSPFTLRVFFGAEADPRSLEESLRRYRRDAKSRLAHFREVEAGIGSEDGMFFPYVTLLSGIAHAEASVRWADKALKLLADRKVRA